MHGTDEIIHVGQLGFTRVNNEVNAFAYDVEVGIGDQDGNFNKGVSVGGKASHLAVDPDEVRIFSGHLRKPRGLALVAAKHGVGVISPLVHLLVTIYLRIGRDIRARFRRGYNEIGRQGIARKA